MKSLGHLESYQVTLTVLTPIFVGSGQELKKNEYIHLRESNKIIVPNFGKLMDYLFSKQLDDAYQRFILGKERPLRDFLRENKVKVEDYQQFADYEIYDVNEIIENRSLKGIQQFVKDNMGYPYIPGSSLKGAIRTAILTEKLRLGVDFEQSYWIKDISNATIPSFDKKKAMNWAQSLEKNILHTLPISAKADDAINSIMKGIAISDSQPIAKNRLTIVQKIDERIDGKAKPLPIFRECLMPETELEFTLTLDRQIMTQSGVDVDYIKKALQRHYQWQQETYLQQFPLLSTEKAITNQGTIMYLGGGVGFPHKTILHAAVGKKKGFEISAEIMDNLFRKHYHRAYARKYKIAPHTKKLTQYKGRYCQMGLCQFVVK